MPELLTDSQPAALFTPSDILHALFKHKWKVVLGAIAGNGKLPIPIESFEAAIKRDGKAVESNLRGFRAGLAAARDRPPGSLPRSGKRVAQPTLVALEAEASALPEPARAIVTEGVRRLVAYQNAGYARLYLDRVERFATLDVDTVVPRSSPACPAAR